MIRRLVYLLLVAALLPVTLCAAADPFIGKWKLDPQRSLLTDTMKVAAVGPHKYAFTFSADNVETIVVDGTDQPGLYDSTLAVSAETPGTWKVVRKSKGRITIVGIWKLSLDGKMLTDDFTSYRLDGSTFHLLYTYQRTAGDAGFAGTWETATTDVNSSYELTVAVFEQDGLSFIYPFGVTKSVHFNGKDYPSTGANAPAGYVATAHRTGELTLDLTDKIGPKIFDTIEAKLSSDAVTLTMTVSRPGNSKPNIMVFVREQ